MAKVSKKEKAFQLFNEGKALGLPEGTRLTYHYEWNKEGKPGETISSEIRTTAKGKTSLPGGEAIASITEIMNPIQKYQEALEKLEEKASEELKEKLRKDEASINEAYKEVF